MIQFQPLVSVIVPTYNRSHTIRKALDSILHQDYPNIEIIIVDDCSDDGTQLLLENFDFNKVPKKILYNPKNRGI